MDITVIDIKSLYNIHFKAFYCTKKSLPYNKKDNDISDFNMIVIMIKELKCEPYISMICKLIRILMSIDSIVLHEYRKYC